MDYEIYLYNNNYYYIMYRLIVKNSLNQYGGDDVKNLDDHTGEFNEIFKNFKF